MTGYWQELDRPWHDTNVVHCAVCGKLIPRRAWRFEGGAGELAACGPDCEELYESYVLPTYGPTPAGRR